jgi:hypothetical protein
VPGGNVLVGEPGGDIEHDDRAMAMDAGKQQEYGKNVLCQCAQIEKVAVQDCVLFALLEITGSEQETLYPNRCYM